MERAPVIGLAGDLLVSWEIPSVSFFVMSDRELCVQVKNT